MTDQDFRHRFISFLGEEFPGLCFDRTIEFNVKNTRSMTASPNVQQSTKLGAVAAIKYNFQSGFIQRAFAIQYFNEHVNPEILATHFPSFFEELRSFVHINVGNVKDPYPPISSQEFAFSNFILVYSKNLDRKRNRYIKRFLDSGYRVRIVEEVQMFKTVFISYGGPDEAVAARINRYLRDEGIRTWFFPDNGEAGSKLHRVMSEGVSRHDRVLFLCSQSSLQRPGVLNELERVLEREAREGGSDILVPITLDDYVFKDWNPKRSDLRDQLCSRVILRMNLADDHDMQKKLSKIKDTLRAFAWT